MAVDHAEMAECIRAVHAKCGCTQKLLAEVLGMSPSAVCRKLHRPSDTRPPGRPRKSVTLQECFQVIRTIRQMAGHVSARFLHRLFFWLPRSWLREVLQRYRKRRARRRRMRLSRLAWSRAGTVWAMDFTALDGRYGGHALCVRDLASTKVIEALLVGGEATSDVVPVLERLFVEHGAPLALKADNGPGFRSVAMKLFLARHGVKPLYSPVRTPEYNGCCEVGNRRVKRIAEDLRQQHDPHAPLSEYLGSAVAIMDQQLVGRSCRALTRKEIWDRREPVTGAMRRELHAHYLRREREEREVRGIAEGATLGHMEQASIGRHAIRDAMCAMNLLTIRRPRL